MTAPTLPPGVDHLDIAGFRVPAELAVRILAAMRGSYPTITDGLGDDSAFKAVLKHLIVTILVQYEGQIAEAAASEAVKQVQAQFAQKGNDARAKATSDAEAIADIGVMDPANEYPAGTDPNDPAPATA